MQDALLAGADAFQELYGDPSSPSSSSDSDTDRLFMLVSLVPRLPDLLNARGAWRRG